MARSRGGFRWTSDNLSTNLQNAPDRVLKAVGDATKYQARKSENFMRSNAPWTDRTANARNGLKAIPFQDGSQFTIVLAHSMPYGIWLEVRWSGKYGIIPQAIRQGGQELMSLLGAVFQTAGLR